MQLAKVVKMADEVFDGRSSGPSYGYSPYGGGPGDRGSVFRGCVLIDLSVKTSLGRVYSTTREMIIAAAGWSCELSVLKPLVSSSVVCARHLMKPVRSDK